MIKDNSLAMRMIERRAELGLSQEQLAEATGIASTQISRYESGKHKPRGKAIIKLAHALNVNFSWLLFGDGIKNAVEVKGSAYLDVSNFLTQETMVRIRFNANLKKWELKNI